MLNVCPSGAAVRGEAAGDQPGFCDWSSSRAQI